MKYFVYIILIIALILILAIYLQDTSPLSISEISSITDNLNEQSALKTPHEILASDTIKQSATLFQLVESGKPLSVSESIEYRTLYQSILLQNQSLLKKFDSQLTVHSNYAMEESNNIGGLGIQGEHDHHDDSGRKNLEQIIESLENIELAKDRLVSFSKIKHVNSIYKNATDILLHLATIPHTKSIQYSTPKITWNDPIGEIFENTLKEFKKSQFVNINSCEYITYMHNALNYYDKLILNIQSRILKNTNLLERKISGRWLSKQTLSPGVDNDIIMRFARNSSNICNH